MMDSTVDITSSLPIHILQRILLFLPADDAARTSILSNTWWAAWAALPVFTFEFVGKHGPSRKITMEDFQEEGKKLMEFIRDSGLKIGEQKAIIEKFRLDVVLRDSDRFVPYINQCIELVTRNCVRELDLSISKEDESTKFYALPSAALAIKSLVVLKLMDFQLKGPLFADNSKFSCLRELSLNCLDLDDEVMSSLIQSSPALEDFSIIICSGFKHLLIPNLPRLQKVILHEGYNAHQKIETIRIEAEHLQSLILNGPKRNLPMGMASLKYLKKLSLVGVSISDDLFEDLVSELHLLEDLTLHMCFDLKRVNISSHVLKRLQLGMVRGMQLQEVTIDAPNLISYDYTGFWLPDIYKFSASNLLTAFLTLVIKYPVDTSWFLSLRQYLANFVQHNDVTLHIYNTGTSSFLPEELQEFSVPELTVVKRITVKDVNVASANYDTWLDGLFWCCHPEHAMVQSSITQSHHKKLASYLCEMLLDSGEFPQCCTSSTTKRWRHFVKDIQSDALTEDIVYKTYFKVSQICFRLEWEDTNIAHEHS